VTIGLTQYVSQNSYWKLDRVELGRSLKRHRERVGMTGRQLARLTGASQSHISRLERGISTASQRDIALIAAALKLDRRTTRRLEVHAQRVFTEIVKFRSAGGVISFDNQLTRLDLERSSRIYRSHDAHWIPGLLQTVDYATSVFESISNFRPEFRDPRYRSDSVELRRVRQQVLLDTDRQFQFVISEHLLNYQLAVAPDADKQRLRLLECVDMPNVEIAIAPGSMPEMTDSIVRFDNTVVLETQIHSFIFDAHSTEGRRYDQLSESLDSSLLKGEAARNAIRRAATT
jgi:transcriptional regulator with XRE-family HTH domain